MVVSSITGPLVGECVEVFAFIGRLVAVRTFDITAIIETHYFFKGVSVTFFVLTYVIVSRHRLRGADSNEAQHEYKAYYN